MHVSCIFADFVCFPQIKEKVKKNTNTFHLHANFVTRGLSIREKLEINRSIIGYFFITRPKVGINLIKKLQMYFSYNFTNMSILYFDLKRIELNTEVPGLVNTSWRLVTGIWLNPNLCELVKTTVRLVISLLNWTLEILTF